MQDFFLNSLPLARIWTLVKILLDI